MTILRIVLASFLLGTMCFAADQKLEVVGDDGSKAVVVGHCTYAGGGYANNVDGIVVRQTGGQITVPWSKLKQINIRDTGKLEGILHVMEGELIFADGSKPETKILAHGNLRGTTNLGEYNSGLDKLRQIIPLR